MNTYNSDGYILIDLKEADIALTTQHISGLYNRVAEEVAKVNKLAIVINAGDLTPLAAVVQKTLNYYVVTTSIYIFKINSNDILIIEEAGEVTVDVSIVPTLTEGVKVADFAIGTTEGSIYAPEFQTEINDSVTSDHLTWSSEKIDTELSAKADSSDLAEVATSGSYKDLSNKPSIPTKTSDLNNDSGFITSAQVPTIDDNTVASDKVWSSYKTSAELANKQNSTDNNLSTTDKTIVGAINEQQSVIGYSYDEYDATTAYSTGDLCIYNNTLYKARQATTGNLPTNTTYWEPTSIADEINELKSNNTQEYNTLTSTHLNDDMLYSRNGRLVTIACQTTLKTAINANDTLVIYSIGTAINKPLGIKPSTTFISGGKVGMVRIDNVSGDIALYNQSGSNIPVSSAVNFTITFYAQG